MTANHVQMLSVSSVRHRINAVNATELTANQIVLVHLKDSSILLLQEILLNTIAAHVSLIDV